MMGVMLATSAIAQDNSNAGAPAPAPTTPPPAAVAPAATTAPEAGAPPATPKPVKHRHHAPAKVVPLSEPPVSLVPGPAQIAIKSLTVRGQAGLKGEAVTHLKQGETVNVISQINLDKHKANEPAQWAQIALPSSVHVWVFSKFIDKANNTVKTKKLNLRGGPGENYSVLGTIEQGTTVNVIRTKGEWMEIEPPTGTYGFVAAMYLTQTPPPTTVPAQPPVAQAAPPVQAAPPPQPVSRVVSHEGVVGPVMSPVAPTKYMLYDPDTYQTIDYLYSTAPDLDLSKYVNMRIVVTGEEGLDARWKDTPLINIQSIQVISENAVSHPILRTPRQSQAR